MFRLKDCKHPGRSSRTAILTITGLSVDLEKSMKYNDTGFTYWETIHDKTRIKPWYVYVK